MGALASGKRCASRDGRHRRQWLSCRFLAVQHMRRASGGGRRAMGNVRFHLLGPVELVVDDVPVSLGPPKQRAVIAALLVDAGTPVSPEALIDRVWGDAPPPE